MATTEALRPLCTSWLAKLREADAKKKRFKETATQCMSFFCGALGFMWDTEFLTKYIGPAVTPTFRITIAKAFELVALFGPTLYWRNPTRLVKPRKRLELDPMLFGGIDPSGWMMFQQAMAQSQQEAAIDDVVSQLLELYLNYTPQEQPGGGLAYHASDAITEALIKGRGCLWPRPYFMPGSDRVLTGCFFDSVDNLLIDPDATSLTDAKWIAQKCVHPTWEAERTYGLPEDSLRGRGTLESSDARAAGESDPWYQTERRNGLTNDIMVYYKIWSKCGPGGRLTGPAQVERELGKAMDAVVGDYAYLVVAPNVPYPLNAPTETLVSSTDSEIKRRFSWPVEFWKDDRWPVSVLDFYRAPNDPWSLAPLAPGLGELTFLNVMISQMANHIWMSSRTFFAEPESQSEQNSQAIRGGTDFVSLRYKASAGQGPKNILDFIQHPPMNPDAWKIVDAVMQMFDRRVGLTELLYGLNPGGVQSRTAEDVATKREMVSIRPDYMAGRVEDWMGEVAEMEKVCANTFVKPQDLRGLFGGVETWLWQQHITNADPEYIMRELRCTIAANSTRKPDKQRDTQNLQQILPALLPIMQEYMGATGDPTPLNGLLTTWGKTIDQDMSQLLLPPLQQQQQGNPEAELAAQQQQMDLEAHQQKLGMQSQQHQQGMMMQAQKGRQDWQMHQARMQALQQQLKLRQQMARQRPKARAA